MYKRHEGDDLLSDDPRLKFKWEWNRGAHGITEEELADWTHFQVSRCIMGDWEISAVQWGADTTYYEPMVEYQGPDRTIFLAGSEDTLLGEEDTTIETRIEAQIKAEEMLIDWITNAEKRAVDWIRKEYKLIMGSIEEVGEEGKDGQSDIQENAFYRLF